MIGLLVWYVPRLDLESIKNALLQAHRDQLAIAVLVVLLTWTVRSTLLWQILRIRLEKLKFLTLAGINMVGAMMDQTIPGRSGIFARWGLLSLREPQSKAFIFSAIMFALLIEGIGLLSIFFFSMALSPQIREFAHWSLSMVFVFVIIGILLGLFYSQALENFSKKFRFGNWSIIKSFFEVAHQVRSPWRFLSWWAIGTFSWLLQIVGIYYLSAAFELPLSFFDASLLLMSVNLAILIPIIPGNVGTIQLVISTLLTKLGFDTEQALAFSIAYHLIQIVPVCLIGGTMLIFFPRESNFEK